MNVVLVDDHRIVRDGLRSLFEREGFTVVGDGGTGREGLALSRELRPDLVIMDVTMPDLNGIDATAQILAAVPGAKVVGLSMNGDRKFVAGMFAAGASGYLLKTCSAEELLLAVREVISGRKYVSPSVTSVVVEGLVESFASSAVPSRPTPREFPAVKALSAREREVLQLLAEGRTSKSIAATLNVAVTTVETHRRQLMDKLGLHSVAELTKFAIREGLTSLD
ncbi:MAG TPA: response regulator transcription factor [Polyangiaceae bacterium]|nr:response regulator transcription factor [Polyangiaceae bacterium]